MIVRCGRCQTSFEVTGPGRVRCPACGTVNEVRGAASGAGEFIAPPPPPAPDPPSPRIVCPECGFSFIVGSVAEAPCPNCGAMVTVAAAGGGEA